MKVLRLRYKQFRDHEGLHLAATAKEFARFSYRLLGLGDLSYEARRFDAVAAIFDLAGFTSFSNQRDPHLAVPTYLGRFLDWLFTTLKSSLSKREDSAQVLLWAPLPNFAKFLGDGVLLIWDVSSSPHFRNKRERDRGVGNIIAALYEVTLAYRTQFLPEVQAKFNRPPQVLRCGIATGDILAIGNGTDFAGQLINVASRLQKIGKLSFACSKHGLEPSECFEQKWREKFLIKMANIRDVGDDEIILVAKAEFEKLPAQDRSLFSDP